jgi:hypothetical protein
MKLVAADDPATQHVKHTPLCKVTLSSTDSLGHMLSTVINAFYHSSPSTSVISRLWSVPAPRTDLVESGYTTSRLLQVGGLQIEPSSKSLDEALVQADDLFVLEVQEDGQWLVDASLVPTIEPGTTENEGVKLEQPSPLFRSEDSFFNRVQRQLSENVATSSSAKGTKLQPTSVKSVVKPAGNTAPPGRASKTKMPGTMGLGNL